MIKNGRLLLKLIVQPNICLRFTLVGLPSKETELVMTLCEVQTSKGEIKTIFVLKYDCDDSFAAFLRRDRHDRDVFGVTACFEGLQLRSRI